MTDIMENLFEYGVDEDSARIISRAIYKHFKGKENKLSNFHCKEFAEIIIDGFFEKTLSEHENLIDANKKKIKTLEGDIYSLQNRKTNLEKLAYTLEEKIRQHDKQNIGETEKDNALAGAKRAYDWIYERTNDCIQAAKAFDSYLLGGRYTEQEYCGDVEKIDAQSIIDRAEGYYL